MAGVTQMDLSLDRLRAAAYSSPAQKIRVLSEHWVAREAYCPNCGEDSITPYRNNNPASDFSCAKCSNDYELKSQKGRFGTKVVDGAYSAMINRVRSGRSPNLFLMSYDVASMAVSNFFVVPNHYFISNIIERRKPLSGSARRAGWVGCNIMLQLIPDSGRIFLVRNGKVEPRPIVIAKWRRTLFLREQKDSPTKGWLLNVMRCIERLGQASFSLRELYAFEEELRKLYPNNQHVREKIRQQLQVLRDHGYLDFSGNGVYRVRAAEN